MSTLFSHIHSQLDHGSSMSFTVTKTGIEGELMIVIYPGKQNEALEWFPPIIFRDQATRLDQTFEKEFRKLPIEKAMDVFRNREIFTGAVESLSLLMKAINEGKQMPKRRAKAKDIKKLADSLFRLQDYEGAMMEYTKLNMLIPDDRGAVRIETCIAMINKKTREQEGYEQEPEEQSDPFLVNPGETPEQL